MDRPENCIIVIFGASGDLTKRKLMPSLFDLYRRNMMPFNFSIVGTGRTDYTDESFREKMAINIKLFARSKPMHQKSLNDFLNRIYYEVMDSSNPDDYLKLNEKLQGLSDSIQANRNYFYYLATAPALYETIPTNLSLQGMQKQGEGEGWKRIVFEKPFGYDRESARTLNVHIRKIFSEEQIYRIDHYLGKETVLNILALRFANGIFEPLWNRNYIQRVEITAVDNMGIEDRGAYYEQAGALRDMIQNHLLELTSIIAMEPPAKFMESAIRNEKIKVFQSLCPPTQENVPKQVIRGQYTESTLRSEKIKAYRKEKNVDKDSRTETYVAMKFYIDNWRWGGVPFYLRTGKRMPTRATEITIYFKKTPHFLFIREYPVKYNDNQLIIRIQPDEGIQLKFGMKTPGTGFNIRSMNMDFHYKDMGESDLPDAYERLLLDGLLGDATLYAREDAIEACWTFVMPILNAWRDNPEIKLYGYPSGTWGPKEANLLFDDPNDDWRYPCKNLVTDDDYCEL